MGGGGKRVKDVDKKKEEEKKNEKKEEKKPQVQRKQEARSLVRIANTDLNAEKPAAIALLGIKGISHSLAKAICTAAGLDYRKKLGSFSEEELQKLEDVARSPHKSGVPSYFLNRRKDPETGEDSHLIGPDLSVRHKFDVQRYVDLKTYRGWRHMFGQPARGQRTRSHFREKGRVVGVLRKAVRLQMGKTGEEATAAKKEEKK